MLQKTEMKTCPCCNQVIPFGTDLTVSLDWNTASRKGVMVDMSPQQAVILSELERRWPGTIENEQIYKRLYGYTVPQSENPANTLRVLISQLRGRLKPLGIGIKCVYGSGYRLDVAP